MKLKSLIMCTYLLAISLGNQFTAVVNFAIQNRDGTVRLQGSSYFMFFVWVMLGTAVVFAIVTPFLQRSHLSPGPNRGRGRGRTGHRICRPARGIAFSKTMKLLFTIAALLLVTPLAILQATPQDEQFQSTAHEYIEGLLASNPEDATQLGDHRFDDKLTDYSADAQAKELARAKDMRQRLEAFNDLSQLTGPNKVDVRLLKDNVDNEIFGLEELKEWQWNPLVYNQSLANSVYLLVARDFAPPEKRIPNLRKRLEAMPRVIAQAKAQPATPAEIYTETAIEQAQGAISLVREGLTPLAESGAAIEQGSRPAAGKDSQSAGRLQTWLQKDLLPRSDGDFRHRRQTSSVRNYTSLSLPTFRWKKS